MSFLTNKSKLFSNTLLDFVEQSNKAETAEELFSLFKETLLVYGYDKIVYSVLKRKSHLQGIDLPTLTLNYPQDWANEYFNKGYEQVDPVTQRIMYTNAPFLWKDLPSILDLTPVQKLILSQGEEAGLLNGIGVPFHDGLGEMSALGIATSQKKVDMNPIIFSMIHLISTQFHTVYASFIKKENDLSNEKKQYLTAREREILLWCVKGKSTKSIALILNISEHGVKFHIQNIMQKLDTNSRITAVIKAIHLGLITP